MIESKENRAADLSRKLLRDTLPQKERCNLTQNCGCKPICEKSPCRKCLDDNPEIPLAMAYVKDQEFCQLFEPMKGLCAGTVFRELYKPWMVQTRGCIR